MKTPLPDHDSICINGDGYYSDRYDCTKYIQCVDTATHKFDCPKGTGWSAVHTTCDHLSNLPGCRPRDSDDVVVVEPPKDVGALF